MRKIKNKKNVAQFSTNGLNPNTEILDIYTVFNERDYRITTDWTNWSADRLREAHAYWGANHVYCMDQLTYMAAQRKELEEERDNFHKALFIRNKERGYNNDVARMRTDLHKKVFALTKDINALIRKEMIWQNFATDCDKFRGMCSRDQTYREKELETRWVNK